MQEALTKTLAHDAENLAVIDAALKSGRIDVATAEYLRVMYSDGMAWFREVFHFLGKCLGAPKAAVVPYDAKTNSGINVPMKIADINPLESYLVQHRLDADPMRNQFFTSHEKCQIDLSVSSIVTVIVAAQKNVYRALDKVTGKYYKKFTDAVVETTRNVIGTRLNNGDIEQLLTDIRKRFADEYVTNAAEVVLGLIGDVDNKLSVDLVRNLDKIRKPYNCLCDVWRIKCLFDLIPQARTFIERMQDLMPDRVLEIRDKFYDIENPRNYRDAKIIINISKDGVVVPMEIICQVRKFFEAEIKTHANYEAIRASATNNTAKEQESSGYMEEGVQRYNLMIVECLKDLFDRVGWNILYSRDHDVSMFEGFPKECKLYYPQRVIDSVRAKLTSAVENEIFHMREVPAILTKEQVSQIYWFMARFILVAAMPYFRSGWSVPKDSDAGELFDFVMKVVQHCYKK